MSIPNTFPIATLNINNWTGPFTSDLQNQGTCLLEKGKIIYLPQLAFILQDHEHYLLSPQLLEKRIKNISFDINTGILKGANTSENGLLQLEKLLLRFNQHAQSLITQLFPKYQKFLQIGRTSFRPIQINNRKISARQDDTRLHVDAFPSSPNQGRRILRVFSNINLEGEPRVWRIGEPFEKVAQQFLPKISRPWPLTHKLLHSCRVTKTRRTEYDHIMLQIHDRMKSNNKYQQQVSKVEFKFPANTTWIVQTDEISHAALRGQHLLEQTFYLPITAMLDPQQSPLKVLERLTERELV